MTRQCGQAATEFALVAPILFVIIFAIIQFGVLMITRSALSYAVRQGARTASIHGSEPTGNDQICASLRAGLASSGVNPDNLGTVTIYKALPGTTEASDSKDVGSCTGGSWSYASGGVGWPYYARAVVDPPDPVGLSVTYNFHFLIPMFGNGLTMSDGTILRMEPLYALGSSGVTLPTPYPTFTPTAYPPYPTATQCPASTPYPTFTPTATGVLTPTNTPVQTDTPTATNTLAATNTPGGC